MSTLSNHNNELTRIKQYNLRSNVYNGRDPDRYYLEEYFKRRPALNAVLATNFDNSDAVQPSNTVIRTAEKVANKDFEIDGTSMVTSQVTFDTTYAGINIQTGTSNDDQAIVLPHLDANQTAWTGTRWSIDKEVIWECAIVVNDTSSTGFWAGLKQSKVGKYNNTDSHQAYFLYAKDATTLGTLTTPANLHFIYSTGTGVHYITDLNIAISAGTLYKLKIMIDKERKVSVYVNGKVYGLTTTSGGSGTTVSNTGQKSAALTTAQNLIPYIGIQTFTNVAKSLTICYEKISRVI